MPTRPRWCSPGEAKHAHQTDGIREHGTHPAVGGDLRALIRELVLAMRRVLSALHARAPANTPPSGRRSRASSFPSPRACRHPRAAISSEPGRRSGPVIVETAPAPAAHRHALVAKSLPTGTPCARRGEPHHQAPLHAKLPYDPIRDFTRASAHRHGGIRAHDQPADSRGDVKESSPMQGDPGKLIHTARRARHRDAPVDGVLRQPRRHRHGAHPSSGHERSVNEVLGGVPTAGLRPTSVRCLTFWTRIRIARRHSAKHSVPA